MLDEDAAGEEIEPPVLMILTKIIEPVVRNVEQRIELHGQVHTDVEVVQGVLGIVGKGFIELLVLLRLHLALGLTPQGCLRVHMLAVDIDGEGNKGGMLADDGFHPVLLGELLSIVLEVDHYLRAALRLLIRRFGQGVGAETVALPHMRLSVPAEGRTGNDVYLLGDHEHGIEAHAETADDLRGIGRPGLSLVIRGF